MRILYVTLLWNGFEDIAFRGLSKASGMPAFVEPLKRIFEAGHSVDFAIVDERERTPNIGPEWLKGSRFYWINQWSFTKLLILISIIRKGKYDFVYAQGGAAGWGNLSAILTQKPCGVRAYGTFLAKHLRSTWWRIFCASPLEVLTHNLPKRFMIMTNDGTKGDLVNRKCCLFPSFYSFNFWLNGVDKQPMHLSTTYSVSGLLKQHGLDSSKPFLLFPARYDPWKRQDLAIEILRILHARGYREIQMLCCGHVYDRHYHTLLSEKLAEFGLTEYAKLIGPLSQSELHILYPESTATLSLYDLSNLGNVVIEAASLGTVLITRKDGTTDFLIEHGQTGFHVENAEEAASIIRNLLDNPHMRKAISERVRQRANEVFDSWNTRSLREIALIENAVAHKPTNRAHRSTGYASRGL